jgi:hypothetical protein
MVGVVGFEFTVTTVAAEVDEHPPVLTVTVNVPELVTSIEEFVDPLLHVFPVAELEVKVTEPPAQKVVGPLVVIVGIGGFGLTVTVIVADVAVQPAEPTVTEYVPLAEITIDCVVSPVLHVFPIAALEVKVTEAP